MTNDADNNAATDDVTEELTDYQQEVRTFQLAFAHELHRLGDVADACPTFDRVLNKAGLPARERYTRDTDQYGYSQTPFRGDDILTPVADEADAKRWALNAARTLVNATDAYGYREVYDEQNGRHVRLTDLLAFLGMPTRQTIPVRITGTFDVTYDVEGWDDANLIDQVSVHRVADLVNYAIRDRAPSVQWKVQHRDVDDNG